MEGRDREKDVCLDLLRELSIYNSLSCLRGLSVNVMDALSVWWRFSVVIVNLGSLKPPRAWAIWQNILLSCFDPHTWTIEELQHSMHTFQVKNAMSTQALLHTRN